MGGAGKELIKLKFLISRFILTEEGNNLFGIWKNNKAVENVDEYIREMRKSGS